MLAQASPMRVLVVDDNVEIHRLFRSILLTEARADDGLDALSAELFSEEAPKTQEPHDPTCLLDFALQGQDAIRMVDEAAAAGRPFSLAFVDIRMPPGIDGIETLNAIWTRHPDLFAVICSAYSDYTWQTMCAKLGHSPNLLILRKPFEAIEVRQIVASVGKMYRVYEGVARALSDHHETTEKLLGLLSGKDAVMQLLMGSRTEALLTVSATGIVCEASPAAARLLGSDVQGSRLDALVPIHLVEDAPGTAARQVVVSRGDHSASLDVDVVVLATAASAGEQDTDAPMYLCRLHERAADGQLASR